MIVRTKGSGDEARFEFGANWQRFVSVLDEQRIGAAEELLTSMLGKERLEGLSFLDIGSGSGLFSLAARRLGARVRSFDFDARSVACTAELKRRYFPGDPDWTVGQGSVLDEDYVRSLGPFDIVYSWGVLHHTGNMWPAIENATLPMPPAGQLYIAIYNDQGRASHYWTSVKRLYNRLPPGFRFLVVWPSFIRLWGPTLLRGALAGAPLRTWRTYARERGMSPWRDVVDWVGGWPFEVAKPEEVFDFVTAKGFRLERLRTCAGGLGCNEFVFRRSSNDRSEDEECAQRSPLRVRSQLATVPEHP